MKGFNNRLQSTRVGYLLDGSRQTLGSRALRVGASSSGDARMYRSPKPAQAPNSQARLPSFAASVCMLGTVRRVGAMGPRRNRPSARRMHRPRNSGGRAAAPARPLGASPSKPSEEWWRSTSRPDLAVWSSSNRGPKTLGPLIHTSFSPGVSVVLRHGPGLQKA